MNFLLATIYANRKAILFFANMKTLVLIFLSKTTLDYLRFSVSGRLLDVLHFLPAVFTSHLSSNWKICYNIIKTVCCSVDLKEN